MLASPEIQIRRADPQNARAIAKVLYESFAEYIWYSPITIAKDVLRKQ
jgi:hypothetical protein